MKANEAIRFNCMQDGLPLAGKIDLWEAAGWLGMPVEQLEANYGYHHPEFQGGEAEAFGGRP